MNNKIQLDEILLVKQAREGNNDAFADLVILYWASIQRYLLRMSGEKELSNDLTQEVFYNAYISIKEIPSNQALNFKPWLYKIATNLALNTFRKQKNYKWLSLDWLLHPSNTDNFSKFEDLTPGPVELSLATEENLQIVRTLKKLPKEQVAILLLRFYHDLTYEELGQVLGQDSPEAIRARLHRARQAFKRIYLSEIKKAEDIQLQDKIIEKEGF